jgi:putative FmdB family regulatory protein
LPIYEYRCDVCGHTVEVFQKFSDDPLESCEVCGGHVAKVLHPVAIHFKGSGFYTTDYGRGSSKARAADAGAKADADAKSGADAKSAGKPDGDAKSDSATAGQSKAKAAGNGGSAKHGEVAGGDAAARRPSSGKAG